MLRILGGRWKGRRLHSPEGLTTRPTLGRARQALFDRLGQRCDGWRVADLFAGTGALGLEALSRGAVHAVFVESNERALSCLRKNIDVCGHEAATSSTVLSGNVFTMLALLRSEPPFDLILIDPPYGELANVRSHYRPSALTPELMELIRAIPRADGCEVVLQAATSSASPPAEILEKTARYGETTFHWLKLDSGTPDRSTNG